MTESRPVGFLLDVMHAHHDRTMMMFQGAPITYGTLAEAVTRHIEELPRQGVAGGAVVALNADYSPQAVAVLLALIANTNIVVPLARPKPGVMEERLRIAEAEVLIDIDEQETVAVKSLGRRGDHPNYALLRQRQAPGLVLFTSGTSGEPKAAVHDFSRLLEKFKRRRGSLRTINFLMFDHWGGLNTLFHTISNAALVLPVPDRSPESVCATIEKYQVELLPASPTFLNLLLVTEAYLRYDLSSLRLITYGTEPMPETTLQRLVSLFPRTRFQQTYGLIELGVLQSTSRANDSLWVRVGGEGFETRVVGGLLQIKAYSAMLGYLNAPSPFTPDGWFVTGDEVEEDGEFIRILGRKSELINVGGEKVYPAEVENVIQGIDDVAEVLVFGERNPLVGNIVCARVRPRSQAVDAGELPGRIKRYCAERLERYKVPLKIELVTEPQFSERFKKRRAGTLSA